MILLKPTITNRNVNIRHPGLDENKYGGSLHHERSIAKHLVQQQCRSGCPLALSNQ